MIHSSTFEIVQIGQVCAVVLGKMLQTTPHSIHDREVPYLRAGLLGALERTSELPMMFCGIKDLQAYRVRRGDLLVAEGGDVGRTEFVPQLSNETIFQNSLHRLRMHTEGDLRYIRYALQAVRASGWLDVLCNRATFGHLTVEKLRQLRIPWPLPSEQQMIADYLDAETARIDTLISTKRRISDLLECRLTTLAEDAVKGCASDMATGIPSLPAIPSSWRVLRNKVFIREVNRRSVDGNDEMLSVSHITGVTPRSEKTVYMFEAESTVGYKLARPGDLVINTMWAWMGAAGVSDVHGIVSPAYGVYEFDDSIMLPKFYDILVRTPAYVAEMTRFSRGVTSSRLRLYPDEFLRLSSPVPPIKTQQAIIDRYASDESIATQARKRIARQIQLLLERRQALITSVVTGEMRVPSTST